LAQGSILGAPALAAAASPAAVDARTAARPTRFGLGYQLFGVRRGGASASDFACFGHAGVSGALALCDPSRDFAFAFTCNRIAPASGRSAAREVLGAVLRELGIGELDSS
jgi:CubicO group peptidase (beta-lactamase class C family)